MYYYHTACNVFPIMSFFYIRDSVIIINVCVVFFPVSLSLSPRVSQDECGDWVTSLCPYGDSGCPDNEGDYDVTMPMPMAGTGTGAVYKVWR